MELPLELWLLQAATLGNCAEASAHSSRRTLPADKNPPAVLQRALLTGRAPEIIKPAVPGGVGISGREAHLPVQPDVSGRITFRVGG
jgi:hypothetical protein